MDVNPNKQPWRSVLVELHFLWFHDPIRPADLSRKLRDIMLARNNLIEDADYHKVVPNQFLIEINQENYSTNYQPIQRRVISQWQEKLLEDLEKANSRQGRKEYTFAGRVEIQIRPGTDLAPNQARIYYQVGWKSQAAGSQVLPPEQLLTACVELVPNGKRWRLHRGIMTIGREPGNDVLLEGVEIQERRLISAQHAFITCDEAKFLLHDGSPSGRPSTNGTFVNSVRVERQGTLLKNGDLILLAAIRPDEPRMDTPGVAVLRFKMDCDS